MVYLTLTVQCQTGVRKVTLRARGHGALCKKGKREKKTLKQLWNTLHFQFGEEFFKNIFKELWSCIKNSTHPYNFSHPKRLRDWLEDLRAGFGNKGSHWFDSSCCWFKMKPLLRWAMLGALLHLCKETMGHLQDTKGNQFTRGDKDKIRSNSVNNLNSEYMVYSKLFFVSKFLFFIMIFVEILILPKEGIRL